MTSSECKLTLSPRILHGIDASAQERTEKREDAGRRYRIDRLSLPIVMRDLYFRKEDPGPGDRVPDFDLPTVGAGRFRSSDLAETGPAMLIFGSSTCPVTDNAAPGLNELYLRFGDRVRFVMVNVREAHPGKAYPQPGTLDAKMAHAERLRDLYGFEFEVAVDDIDGTLHRALSPKPNSAYVLGAGGTILFRAQWGQRHESPGSRPGCYRRRRIATSLRERRCAQAHASHAAQPLTRSRPGGQRRLGGHVARGAPARGHRPRAQGSSRPPPQSPDARWAPADPIPP